MNLTWSCESALKKEYMNEEQSNDRDEAVGNGSTELEGNSLKDSTNVHLVS